MCACVWVRDIGWNGFTNGSLHTQTHMCTQQNKRFARIPTIDWRWDARIYTFIIYQWHQQCVHFCVKLVCCANNARYAPVPLTTYSCLNASMCCKSERKHFIVHSGKMFVFFSLCFSPFKVSTAKWLMIMMMMVHRTMVRWVINDCEQLCRRFLSSFPSRWLLATFWTFQYEILVSHFFSTIITFQEYGMFSNGFVEVSTLSRKSLNGVWCTCDVLLQSHMWQHELQNENRKCHFVVSLFGHDISTALFRSNAGEKSII